MTTNFRVLVVDDDFHVARLHRDYVARVPGFTALDPVGSGESALRAISALRPDLVLIDIFLPDRSGLDLLSQIDVDAMVLSAARDSESILRARRRGALAYLIKPFDPEVLSVKLRGYARYRKLLDSSSNLDQESVERASRQFSAAETSKKPRSVTEQEIRGALQRASGQHRTALEVAQEIGVSRATAQRYLSVLVEDGSVSVSLRYGATGRPEHSYSLSS
ncbi:two-component system CitB family response regulator [Psychromicrobium silvestre]|uniref:Transcriptional regulatory protein n=1 Tax=Psychromicrobium silvestre TaxID=1645614 RepID=A0A7Y9S3V0_9MICC|nr:response regulator [Psychromicrobium silvestre]NYE94068.1 two-component system CitB family response regulator [Psychromicrobium silvestre]